MKDFLIQTAKLANENAIAKGFWDGEVSKNEKLMLIVCELAEAVEAHRKGKRTDIVKFYGQESKEKNAFELYVKDTVEDELADALIRALDYCYYYQIKLDDIREYELNPKFKDETNFASEIFYLSSLIGLMNTGTDPYVILTRFIHFLVWACKHKWSVDIQRHVHLKMEYNSKRPYKHGKAY